MELNPDAEQVGFVRVAGQGSENAILEMAGGEFCGNASMCAAAWYVTKYGRKEPEAGTYTVTLKISGTHSPVQVDLSKQMMDLMHACICQLLWG